MNETPQLPAPTGPAGAPSRAAWLPLLVLGVLTLIWGYTWVLVKQALHYAPPFAFAAQRAVGGALALLLVLRWRGRSLALPPLGMTLGIGLVQTGVFLAIQTWAMVAGGAGKTAVLIYTMPLWTLLLGWLVLRERPDARQWPAAALTLLGLTLVISPWQLAGSGLSQALGVASAMVWAGANVLMKHLRTRRQIDLLSVTAWQMAFGAAALVLLSGLVPEPPTQWLGRYVLILGFIAVVSTGLAWLMWTYLLDTMPAWKASLSLLGVPLVAVISSRLQTDETFSVWELGGIALVASGLALMSLISRRRQSGGAG